MDIKDMTQRVSRLSQVAEEARRRNEGSPAYRYLRVILRPTDCPGTFEFVLQNVGEESFWQVVISRYELVGPPAFGVDDTFMRPPSDAYPPIVVNRIAPRQTVKLCEERWQAHDRYQLRPESNLIGVRFSLEDSDQELTRAAVPFLVVGDVPLRPREDPRPWYERQHPRAHALGKATGAFFRTLLRRT